jgi:hypothetical protein
MSKKASPRFVPCLYLPTVKSNALLSQYGGRPFKVSELDHWTVIVPSGKLMDELRRFPDDVVSAPHGTSDVRPYPML